MASLEEHSRAGTSADEIRQKVRTSYARIAKEGASCCGPSCCEPQDRSAEKISEGLGYLREETEAVPLGSNLGLGCGNPLAFSSLKPGETVLDLGSGGGFDCFLASREVGESGHVIGVDMTPEMISRARENARKGNYSNVDFRLGEIESLPVENNIVDVIISNCVINLSPDKPRVFAEAFRVLKPGGRLAISDIVALGDLPAEILEDPLLYVGCMAGASPVSDLENFLIASGFEKVRILPKDGSRSFIENWAPGRNISEFLVSAVIEAVKPSGTEQD